MSLFFCFVFFLILSSLCLCSTLQPWRWVCDLHPPRPTLFAIIPRIWTHYRTRPNTSAPNQGQAPLWFRTIARMLIGEKKKKKKSKWLATTAPCSKWRTISPFTTAPSVTKTSYWNAYMTRFMFFAEPPPYPPPTPFSPLDLLSPRAKRKKMVEVYLLYFLIIALWCKMCRKCLRFCHLKHWRVCICIVCLESLCLVILLIAMHTVSQTVSWHRTQNFAFYSVATFQNNVLFFPMPTLLFQEVFKGKKMWKTTAFIVTTFHSMKVLRWFLQRQIDAPWSVSVSYGWRPCYSCTLFRFKQPGCRLCSVKGNQTSAWEVSAWMLRICVQHTT